MREELIKVLNENGYGKSTYSDSHTAMLFRHRSGSITCIICIDNIIQPTLFSKESLLPYREAAKRLMPELQNHNILFIVEDTKEAPKRYRTENMVIFNYIDTPKILYQRGVNPDFLKVCDDWRNRIKVQKFEKKYRDVCSSVKRYFVFATYLLISMNVIVFLLYARHSRDMFVLSKEAVSASGEYYRYISYMFMHAGFIHLLGNMLCLKRIGQFYEEHNGALRLLFVYLAGGVCAGYASITLNSRFISTTGCSGAIFALIGAVFMESLLLRNQRMAKSIVIIMLYNICMGMISPQIDNIAHIGGFAAGMLLGYILYAEKSITEDIIYIKALKKMNRKGVWCHVTK